MCPVPGDKDTSKPTGPAKPKSSKKKELPPVAGKEVVGRHVAVWSQKQMTWPKAVIAQYNPDKREHLIRYTERAEGSVKHEELWVDLSKTRFQWLGELSKDATPNPSFIDAPKKEDVIGYQVKVFWPGMARWYQGKVETYNPKNGKHTVKYRDGDIQELQLRHEAVVYVKKCATPQRERPALPKSGSKSVSKRPRSAEDSSSDDRKSKSGRSDNPGDKSAAGGRKNNPGNSSIKGPRSYSDDPDMDDASEGCDDDDDGSEMYVEELDHGDEDSDFDDDVPLLVKSGNNPKKLQRMGSSKKQQRGTVLRVGSVKKPGRPSSKNPGGGPGRDLGATAGMPKRRGRPPGSGMGRRMGRLSTDVSKRMYRQRKLTHAEEESLKATGGAVVGARVAVLWSEDGSFFKGKLVQFDSYHKRHKILYDDGEEEWTGLQREHFRCLVPRARSAGCTLGFIEAMNQLGGGREEGLGLTPGAAPDAMSTRSQLTFAHLGTVAPSGDTASAPPAIDGSCVHWAVSVWCDLDGRWYRGEVLSCDPERRRLLVLYDDGEDEWMDVDAEKLTWHAPLSKERKGSFPGLAPGAEPPQGRAAVGWRVAVFWKGDAAFYPGEITGYIESAGKHEVSYDDGEEGTIILNEDRIKWILPPGVAVDHENLERREAGGARPSRKVTAGGDSDPDYEFEQQMYQHQGVMRGQGRRGGHRGGGGGLHMYRSGSLWRDSPTAAGVSPIAGGAGGGGGLMQGHPGARPRLVHGGLGPSDVPNGQPALIRSLHRVPSFALHHVDGDGALQSAVTVRVYLSAPTLDDNGPQEGAAPPSSEEGARARLEALSCMARRVARAQQAIVKGVPTPLPLHVTPPILHIGHRTPQNTPRNQHQTPRQQGLHHQHQLNHRLARPPVTSYSPFQRHRPRLSDEDDDDEEDEEEDEERKKGSMPSSNLASDVEDEGMLSKDGSGAGRPGAGGDGDSEDEGEEIALMSPRTLALKGAKVKPGSARGTPTGPGEGPTGSPGAGPAPGPHHHQQEQPGVQPLKTVAVAAPELQPDVEAANNAAHGSGIMHSPSLDALHMPSLPVVESVENLLGLGGAAGAAQEEEHPVLQDA